MPPASFFPERSWAVALPSTKLTPVVIVASDPPYSSTNIGAEVFYGQKDGALLPSPHPATTGRLSASFEAEYSNKGSVGPHDTSTLRRGSARRRLRRFLVSTGLLVLAVSTPTPVAAAFFPFTAVDILVNGAGLLAATGSLAVPVLSLRTANQVDNVGQSCLIAAYAICGLGYLIILFLMLKERAEAHDRRFFVLVAILAGFQAQTAVGTYGGLSGIDGLKVWGPLGLGFGLLFASVWTAIFGTGAAAIGTLTNQAV